MHRSSFTHEEADEIRSVLREIRRAEPEEAKSLRGGLRRRFDFYISDFSDDNTGFTVSDFDQQVSWGVIRIVDAD
jgi:hypothetical protein